MNKLTVDIEEGGRRRQLVANIGELEIRDDSWDDDTFMHDFKYRASSHNPQYSGHFKMVPDDRGVQYTIIELPRRKTYHTVTVIVNEFTMSEFRGAEAEANVPKHAELTTVEEDGVKYVVFNWEE